MWWGGCHDICNFSLWYGGKKVSLPALVCLDSEYGRCRTVIVAFKFNQPCKQRRVGSHGSCSTETNADCVKMPMMWICAVSLLLMMEMLTNTGVRSCWWSRPWECCTCTREGIRTALDSWSLAEDLCVMQWHACLCMMYLCLPCWSGSKFCVGCLVTLLVFFFFWYMPVLHQKTYLLTKSS